MRSLLKLGASLLLLALVLIGATYIMLRNHGQSHPASAAGRAAGSEARAIGDGIVAVDLTGPIDLTLRQGDKPSLRVSGEQRLLANVATEQEGTVLRIGTKGMVFHHRQPLQVELVLPSLNRLVVNGSGDSSVAGFSGERLDLRLLGAADISFDGRYRQVDASVQGSGDLVLNTGSGDSVKLALLGSGRIRSSGNCKVLELNLNGSGDVDAQHLASDDVAINLLGSGSAQVFARHAVDVKLTGSGDIEVFGNPQQRSVQRTGAGNVSWNR